MAYTLTMPEVGETVTEGTIEKWLKQPGEKVEKYEPIVEINTDKVNVELPSPVSGTVKEHLAQEGETVLIGANLATIDEVAGETPAEIAPPKPTEEPAKAAEPAAASVSLKADPPKGRGNGSADGGGPNRATPRVRKMAEELGVDLALVTGTGPRGRIVEDDVRAFADSGAKSGAATAVAEKPAAAPRKPAKPGEDEEAVALTSIRKTIASRMTQSAAVPVAWLVVECDVTGLAALRNAKKAAFEERHGISLTYLPFAAHAVSQALLDHPYLNASWGEDKIILKKRVNLSIAVATDRGLMVPVIQDADRMSVTGLALAMTELGQRTRDNKLKIEDVEGGTFTLDNTGAFGSIVSQAIINTGQSAIITFERVTKQPRMVGEDAIGVRSVVNMCLTFDHRVLDGHIAGEFLQDVKRRMEAYSPDTGLD
jgi:2-oxoisovalerate dehydrogenase E2 component (dihydrolipoyl transacylase)